MRTPLSVRDYVSHMLLTSQSRHCIINIIWMSRPKLLPGDDPCPISHPSCRCQCIVGGSSSWSEYQKYTTMNVWKRVVSYLLKLKKPSVPGSEVRLSSMHIASRCLPITSLETPKQMWIDSTEIGKSYVPHSPRNDSKTASSTQYPQN